MHLLRHLEASIPLSHVSRKELQKRPVGMIKPSKSCVVRCHHLPLHPRWPLHPISISVTLAKDTSGPRAVLARRAREALDPGSLFWSTRSGPSRYPKNSMGLRWTQSDIPAPSKGSPMEAPTPLRDLHWTPRKKVKVYIYISSAEPKHYRSPSFGSRTILYFRGRGNH